MFNWLRFDSPIVEKLTLFTNLVIINILWLITCLPIITIGPATCAMYYVIYQLVNKQSDEVVIPFFTSFFSNFKQATLIWVPHLLIGVVYIAESIYLTVDGNGLYTNMNQMLKQENPDAVSLLVPVSLTEQLTVQLLNAKIPVILEKPPGINRDQTLRMIEAAERTGTPNQVAFNRRYMPMIRRFRELRKDCYAHMWQYDFFRMGRRDLDFSTTSIHGIDTLKFLVGQPYRRVSFNYYSNPNCLDLVPGIMLDCEFADGEVGRISFAPATGISAERCLMHGTNEMIFASLPYHSQDGSLDGSGSILLAREGKVILKEEATKSELCVENGFYGENEHFFNCIQTGIRPEGDILSGLQSVEIADCIRNRVAYYDADI